MGGISASLASLSFGASPSAHPVGKQGKRTRPVRSGTRPMTRSRTLVLAAVLLVSLLASAAPASADSPAQKMIRKVNAYRKHRGVAPLHSSSSLNGSARRYARHMMHAGYFGHASRIQALRRFRRLGEIIEMHPGYSLDLGGALHAWA